MKYDTHHFLSFDYREISKETHEYIKDCEPTYRDLCEPLDEHIYNIEDIELCETERSELIEKELTALHSIMRIEGCDYFRITY